MVYCEQTRLLMENLTDNKLMKLLTAKNAGALRVIYHRYEKKIFNFILRYTGSRAIARESRLSVSHRIGGAAPFLSRTWRTALAILSIPKGFIMNELIPLDV